MHRIAASLLCLAIVAACARAPAPAEPAAKSDTAPAPVAASTVSDAPPVPTISGVPCMAATEGAPPSPFLPDTPAGVVSDFYDKVLAGYVGGAPKGDQLESWRPHLTHALADALARAAAERDRAATEGPPDEKPPYLEGSFFASLFEGYTHARPLTVATEGDQARVPVCFAYVDADGRTEWTDIVLLRKEGGAWRIDDVVYGGQWDFANTGTLREALPKE